MSNAKGPTPATVEAVRERDNDTCAWCGLVVYGDRGRDWSVHHRRPRGSGGTSEAWVDEPENLVLLHGSGVIESGKLSCHGIVEKNRHRAKLRGFLVSRAANHRSRDMPIVHALHGIVRLVGDGIVKISGVPDAT